MSSSTTSIPSVQLWWDSLLGYTATGLVCNFGFRPHQSFSSHIGGSSPNRSGGFLLRTETQKLCIWSRKQRRPTTLSFRRAFWGTSKTRKISMNLIKRRTGEKFCNERKIVIWTFYLIRPASTSRTFRKHGRAPRCPSATKTCCVQEFSLFAARFCSSFGNSTPSLKIELVFITFRFPRGTNAFVFYGLSLNSINLSGNIYLNFILGCLIEIPGNTIAWVSNFESEERKPLCSQVIRRWLSTSSAARYRSRARCCFAGWPAFVEASCLRRFSGSKSCCSWSAKWQSPLRSQSFLFTQVGWKYLFWQFPMNFINFLYCFSAEMLPTLIRSGGVGTFSTFSRFGALLAPFVPLLKRYYDFLPLMVYGAFAFISGILAMTLPETLGANLPDTIEEAENMGKRSKPRSEQTRL